MNLLPSERETVITMDDGSDYVEVYTSQRTVMTKLDKHPETWEVIRQDERSKTYRAEKGMISFRMGKKTWNKQS